MTPLDAVLKALSNPRRRRIYQLVWRHGRRGPGVSIGEICRRGRLKQPAVSHHVACLARAGLVERRKDRWWVRCRPAQAGLAALARFARNPGLDPAPAPSR